MGEVLEIREEVSESSDCSSASRRESWVAAKDGMSTASFGDILLLRLSWLRVRKMSSGEF